MDTSFGASLIIDLGDGDYASISGLDNIARVVDSFREIITESVSPLDEIDGNMVHVRVSKDRVMAMLLASPGVQFGREDE